VSQIAEDTQVFPSEMMAAVFGNADMTIEGALPKAIQPMGRAGKDEEMGGTIVYFASKAGAYCSGTLHLIDGGRLGIMPGATY
jgi:NAD(P)-dependent dehydrogenase (short-subunit alcohol dehydrogenase family)